MSDEHEPIPTLALNFTEPMDMIFYILYILKYLKYPMNMGTRIEFENPMDV